MMQLDEYRAVIRIVLEDHGVQDPEAVIADIARSMRLADVISGKGRTAPAAAQTQSASPVLIKTAPAAPPATAPTTGARIISVAPPVAGAEEEPEPAEYWSPSNLVTHLESILPLSITVEVPGIPEPLVLQRLVSSPGMKFAHVAYLLPGQDIGPRLTAMTSQREFNADSMIADIANQAGAMYRKDPKRIEPRLPGAPPPMPTAADFAKMTVQGSDGFRDSRDSLNGPDAMQARETAATWGATRSEKWR